MDFLVVALRLIHIVGAAYWAGGALVVAFLVEPAAAAAGPAGGQFMQRMGQGKYGMSMTIAAILTILAGFLLYWRFGYSLNSITGTVLLGGGIIGLAALVYGGAVTGPAAAKMGRLANEIQAGGKPPSADQGARIASLTARLSQAGRVNAVLVLIALIAMAVARYL